MTNSMKISFPGSTTTAGKQRTASWELRFSYGKVQMGFSKSQSHKTKTKWFDLEEVEIIMGSLLENQTELAGLVETAKAGLELGMVIFDGELVDPTPEPAKEEAEEVPTPPPAPAKTFSLSSGTPVPPPAPSVSTIAKAPSKSRSDKISELKIKMGR